MPKFKPGQEVICITDGWVHHDRYTGFWFWKKRKEFLSGPKYGDIVTVVNYKKPEFIRLNGYGNNGFQDKCFEPVADITELKEILNQEKTKH